MRRQSLVLVLIAIFSVSAAGAVLIIPRLVRVPLPAASSASPDLATQITAYEELVKENPTNARYWIALGNLSVRQRDWGKAAESFQKALELKPEDTEIRRELGIVLWHLGRQEEGLRYLDEAIQQDPNSVISYFYLGMVLAGMPGREAEAVAALEKVIATSGDSEVAGQARQMLAELKAKVGEPSAGANTLLPQSLAGLALKDFYSGERAKQEIERLHGGKVTVQSGSVGYYSDGERSATFWISETPSEEEAGALLTRMKESIAQGGHALLLPSERFNAGTGIHKSLYSHWHGASPLLLGQEELGHLGGS